MFLSEFKIIGFDRKIYIRNWTTLTPAPNPSAHRYTKFAPNSPTVLNGKIPTEEDRGKVRLSCSR